MRIPLRAYTRVLNSYLRPQWPLLLLLGVLMAAAIALQLWLPLLVRNFLDLATAGQGGRQLLTLALLYIGGAFVQQLATAAARYVGQGVSWTATNQLRSDLAAHCLSLDMSFHKAHRPGELIERIDGDVGTLTNFFSQFFIDVAANAVLLLGVLVLLFREDWRIGLGMAAFSGFALWLLMWLRALGTKYWLAVRGTRAQVFGFIGEVLTATADIRSSGAVPYVQRRFHELLRSWYPNTRSAGLAGGMMWASSLTIFAIGHAVAFSLGLTLWSKGAITLGTVYLIFNYTELLRRPIEQIRMQLQELQQAGAAIHRVQDLLARTTQVPDGPGTPIPGGSLSVAFDAVSFEYEPGERVLHDLALEVAPGQVVGLLGRTGSGKSSIARLLLRLHDPVAGTIRLGGVDSRLAKLRDLRRRVGMVTQSVELFRASVRENLTFFDTTIPDSRILEVLDELGLRPWLDALPAGLDSELQAGGTSLSGGEAQLLAMARIFLADPGLIILDEASSRLDPATEQWIERAIDKLLQGRTAIIIAHRLATVQRADAIVVLDRGRILEYGPREALAADPTSRFYQLLQTGQEDLLA